jgi:hypothetical protein
MDKPERAPNFVPRGAIRLSEAFEAFCCRLEPEWQDLQQRCVQWDEYLENDIDERGEDPYPTGCWIWHLADMKVSANVRFAPILLQKSFWGDKPKFLEPLMRFTSSDVRDHIVSSKIDHGPPEWRRKAMQQQRTPKINFREIFRVVRFSTFATISASSRHCLLSLIEPTDALQG